MFHVYTPAAPLKCWFSSVTLTAHAADHVNQFPRILDTLSPSNRPFTHTVIAQLYRLYLMLVLHLSSPAYTNVPDRRISQKDPFCSHQRL